MEKTMGLTSYKFMVAAKMAVLNALKKEGRKIYIQAVCLRSLEQIDARYKAVLSVRDMPTTRWIAHYRKGDSRIVLDRYERAERIFEKITDDSATITADAMQPETKDEK